MVPNNTTHRELDGIKEKPCNCIIYLDWFFYKKTKNTTSIYSSDCIATTKTRIGRGRGRFSPILFFFLAFSLQPTSPLYHGCFFLHPYTFGNTESTLEVLFERTSSITSMAGVVLQELWLSLVQGTLRSVELQWRWWSIFESFVGGWR